MNPLSKLFLSTNLLYIDNCLVIQEFPNPREVLIEEYGEQNLNQLLSNNILYIISNNQYNGVVLNSTIRLEELDHIHEALKNGHKIGKRTPDPQISQYAPMVNMKYKVVEVHRFFDVNNYSNEIRGENNDNV